MLSPFLSRLVALKECSVPVFVCRLFSPPLPLQLTPRDQCDEEAVPGVYRSIEVCHCVSPSSLIYSCRCCCRSFGLQTSRPTDRPAAFLVLSCLAPTVTMSSLQAFALGLGTTLVTLATVQVIAYPVGRTLQAALRPRIKVTPLNVRATCVEYHRKSQVRCYWRERTGRRCCCYCFCFF